MFCPNPRSVANIRPSKDFEASLAQCNGENDHVHLLLVYPPKISLSKLVNSLKGVSSRLLREARPEVSGK